MAEEYSGHRWLGAVSAAEVGARFRGRNKRPYPRWSTLSTITDAVEGKRFAFDVTSFGFPVARWQYDIEPANGGCVVTESAWDRRPGWFGGPSSAATEVWRCDELNRANIEATLLRLKAKAESA